MPADEQPPKEIWLDDEAMERHWAKVAADRRRKYGIPNDEEEDEPPPGSYSENGLSLIARG